MDVRCDRCQTEYELDDGSVSDAGTSVQCTTCNHQFIVTRRPSSPLHQMALTPPGGTEKVAEPEVPEWTLSTDDGKVHRFRDLNTLQKWIVERKVSRTDRLSRAGGSWLALGDMEELSSFFRVVDEADRARAPRSAGSGPIAKSAAARRSTGSAPYGTTARTPAGAAGTPPPVPSDARRTVPSDGPTVPNRRLPDPGSDAVTPTRSPRRTPGLGLPTTNAAQTAVMPAVTAAPASPSSPIGAAVPKPAAPSPSRSHQLAIEREGERASIPNTFSFDSADETAGTDADLLMPRHRGRNAAIAVVLVAGLGGGGAYIWKTQGGEHLATTIPGAAEKTKLASVDASAEVAALAETPPAAPPAPSSAEVAAPVAPKPEAKEIAAKEPAAKAPSGAKAPSVAAHGKASVSTQASGHGGTAATTRAAANAGEPAANNYDRLVTEGDRLLERGQAAKAEKLYMQALTAKADGAGAMTGLAYVYLDRQRHYKAIETFRKVLAAQPTYGPALFGIAESYRGHGDSTQALGAYRQYLVISPSGADAPAARRQIKDLESAGPAASNDHGANANANSKKESPPAQDEE